MSARAGPDPPIERWVTTLELRGQARRLRAWFDASFADPRRTHEGRFCWDWWHVPDQYTLLRTPADRYFPAPMVEALRAALAAWGRARLGCHALSPLWLACYVDGCHQELHGDLPHGPFAFVLSLTDWQTRRFTGGETLLAREPLLDWWRGLDPRAGVERGALLEAIAPEFGQLLAFDPRLPHGVAAVRGPLDPRAGRLVVHGWFTQPAPVIEGPLPARQLRSRLRSLARAIEGELAELAVQPVGFLCFGARVGRSGRLSRPARLVDTLRAPAERQPALGELRARLSAAFAALEFASQPAPSTIRVPIAFE